MPHNFQDRLDRGLAFEQGPGLEILHKRFPNSWIINNKVDPSESTAGNLIGPRAYKGVDSEENIALPDYQIINELGESNWIDAKLKGAAYPEGGRYYFTIDIKVNEKYKKFPLWIRDHLWLLFNHETTNHMYLAQFQMDHKVKFFRNKYGTGNIPIYYLDELTQIN